MTCSLPLCSSLEGTWRDETNLDTQSDIEIWWLTTGGGGLSNIELPTPSLLLAFWRNIMKISFRWCVVVFRCLCAQACSSQPTHTVTFHVCRDMMKWFWIWLCMLVQLCTCPHVLFCSSYTHTHACTQAWASSRHFASNFWSLTERPMNY